VRGAPRNGGARRRENYETLRFKISIKKQRFGSRVTAQWPPVGVAYVNKKDHVNLQKNACQHTGECIVNMQLKFYKHVNKKYMATYKL
jgi:hypothetical protein